MGSFQRCLVGPMKNPNGLDLLSGGPPKGLLWAPRQALMGWICLVGGLQRALVGPMKGAHGLDLLSGGTSKSALWPHGRQYGPAAAQPSQGLAGDLHTKSEY